MIFGGMGFSFGCMGITPRTGVPAASSLAPTTMLSSYTFDGEVDAWTLSAAAPIGEYAMGEPFLVSSAEVEFTQTGTPSSLDGSGRRQNGVTENPYYTGSGDTQGIDELLANSSVAAGVLYSSALDFDVATAGTNYVVTSGKEVSLVKAERDPAATASTRGIFDHIDVMTIVPTAKHPNVGDFRPPFNISDKTSFVNVGDLDRGCCQTLDVSSLVTAGGVRDYALVLADWRNPLASFGEPQGEYRRVPEVLTHIHSTNYAAYLANLIWETGVHLHSSALSDSQWLELAKYVVQAGIDLCGEVEAGTDGSIGEGQKHFYHATLFWSAALTGNSRLYAAAQGMKSNLDQPVRSLIGNVGLATAWPAGNQGGNFQYVQPQRTEDVGKPIWSTSGNGGSTADTSIMQRAYLDTSGRGRFKEWIPFLAVKSNKLPAGKDMLIAGDPSREAMIQFLYRERKTTPGDIWASGGFFTYISTSAKNAFDLFEPYWGTVAETNWLPDMPLPFEATAGSGQVSWDFSTYYNANYGSQTALTGFNVRVAQYSPVQPVEVSTSVTSSSTEVPGIPVYVSAQLQNTNGWGEWSHVDKIYTADSAPRNKVTPTGTAAGTVTNVVAPVLMVKKYPSSQAAVFEPAANGVELGLPIYLGPGRWTGALTGAITYEVEVDTGGGWAAGSGTITAESNGARFYSPASSEGSADMRSKITVDGVTAYSAAITLGTLPTIPTATIIDTTFTYSDNLLYEAVLATAASSIGNATHVVEPNYYAETDPDEFGNTVVLANGVIRADKTAAFPKWNAINLGATKPLTIGNTYSYAIKAPIGVPAAWNREQKFKLGSASGLADYRALVTTAYTPQPRVVEYTGTFVATTTDLFMYLENSSNSGGTGGGDVVIDSILVEDITP